MRTWPGRAPRWPAVALSLALVVVGVAGCGSGPRLETLWDAPRFNLTDESGRPFSSDALAGRVWLADFIYTHCPDECPIYLSPKMASLQARIIAANLADQVQLISFTVDPRRDTPAVLADYAAAYGADPRVWRFLTGPDATIGPLLQTGFKVGAAVPADAVTVTPPTPAPAYALIHSAYFLLVDRQGKIRGTYDGEQVPADDMLKGIRQLLNER